MRGIFGRGVAGLAVVLGLLVGSAQAAGPLVERVTTVVPFPRGLVMKDGVLYVLARGRVRDSGGVSAAVNDRAGTIYAVDPTIAEPADQPTVGEAVRTNGVVFAEPTSPPFKLWDRTVEHPADDRQTDRPYCTLRWHEPTQSFYLCAFSGIDLAGTPSFSKNPTDALLRYDTRTNSWHDVERHDAGAGDEYPHHNPKRNPPPHGWLNGPDNCLVVGNQLYAVSKDNSLLVRYDLSALIDDPSAGPPPGVVVFDHRIPFGPFDKRDYFGQSGLAFHDGWLYVAYRTSGAILRIRLNADGAPKKPIRAQLVAVFDPYDPQTKKSANITDIDVDDQGRLYAVSASPARVYRFTPDSESVFDGRTGHEKPWLDLAATLGKPKLKSENVLIHDDYAYITSGDAYAFQSGADGAVYRAKID